MNLHKFFSVGPFYKRGTTDIAHLLCYRVFNDPHSALVTIFFLCEVPKHKCFVKNYTKILYLQKTEKNIHIPHGKTHVKTLTGIRKINRDNLSGSESVLSDPFSF